MTCNLTKTGTVQNLISFLSSLSKEPDDKLKDKKTILSDYIGNHSEELLHNNPDLSSLKERIKDNTDIDDNLKSFAIKSIFSTEAKGFIPPLWELDKNQCPKNTNHFINVLRTIANGLDRINEDDNIVSEYFKLLLTTNLTSLSSILAKEVRFFYQQLLNSGHFPNSKEDENKWITVTNNSFTTNIPRNLLQVQSCKFKAQLNSTFKDSKKKVVLQISDEFIKYLISGKYRLNGSNVLDAFREANENLVFDLKDQCKKFIEANMEPITLKYILNSAIEYDYRELIVVCLNIIINHAKEYDVQQLLKNRLLSKKAKNILQCGLSIANLNSYLPSNPPSISVTVSEYGEVRVSTNLSYYNVSRHCSNTNWNIVYRTFDILKKLDNSLRINDIDLTLKERKDCPYKGNEFDDNKRLSPNDGNMLMKLYYKFRNFTNKIPSQHPDYTYKGNFKIKPITEKIKTFSTSINSFKLKYSGCNRYTDFTIRLSKEGSSKPHQTTSLPTFLLEKIKSNSYYITPLGLDFADDILDLIKLLPNIKELDVKTPFLTTFEDVEKYVNFFAQDNKNTNRKPILRTLNLENVKPAINDKQMEILSIYLRDLYRLSIQSDKITNLVLPNARYVNWEGCTSIVNFSVPDEVEIYPSQSSQDSYIYGEDDEILNKSEEIMFKYLKWNRYHMDNDSIKHTMSVSVEELNPDLPEQITITLNNGKRVTVSFDVSIGGRMREC